MPQSSAKQFSGIFISYRRNDCPGHAGRLSDKLVDHFGADQIFMDVDSIAPGEDFVEVIENAVGSCSILIAMIGCDWLTGPENKSRLLDNANDYVRLEIATALRRNVLVIPVLVQGASMPQAEDLPEQLRALTRRNAIDLSDARWSRDVVHLISHLDMILAREGTTTRLVRPTEAVAQMAGSPRTGSTRPQFEARLEDGNKRKRYKYAALVSLGLLAGLLVVGALIGLWSRRPPENNNAPPVSSPSVDTKNLTAEENAARGREFSLQRKFVESEPYWRAAIDQDPFNAEYQNRLGVALFFQKKYVEAEPFLRKAVAIDSRNAQYKADVGDVLSSQAKYAEAEPFHREALRLMPNNGDQINNVGIDLYFQKKYAEAEASFRKAILWKPNDPEIQNNLGNALFDQQKYAEAKTYYEQALRLQPNNPYFQSNVKKVADVLREVGNVTP